MRITRKFLVVLIVVVLLIAVMPLVSAYEAYMINVKVHVEERLNVYKVARLATPDEIANAQALGVVFPSEEPNPPWVDDPFNVPTYTCVVWLVTIIVQNPYDYAMTNVTVNDHFGAELGGEPLGEEAVDVFVMTHSRGKSHKASHESQYRITWYVTYEEGGVFSPPDDVANGGELGPGEAEALQVLVWTKLNPSGRQSYTSPGEYEMNSGPTAKWFNVPMGDEPSSQWSGYGMPLYITAYD